MTTSGGQACCCCWGVILFNTLVTLLFMSLPYNYITPTLSIEQFYIPALNKLAKDPTDTTISFDLKFDNANQPRSILYDAVNVTLYYGKDLGVAVANVSIPAFDQNPALKYSHDQVHKKQSATSFGVPWDTAREEVAVNGTAMFRVDVETKVRYAFIARTAKRYQIHVGGNLKVNDKGALVKRHNHGVQLSSASLHLSTSARVAGLALFVLLLLCF